MFITNTKKLNKLGERW